MTKKGTKRRKGANRSKGGKPGYYFGQVKRVDINSIAVYAAQV